MFLTISYYLGAEKRAKKPAVYAGFAKIYWDKCPGLLGHLSRAMVGPIPRFIGDISLGKLPFRTLLKNVPLFGIIY